MSLSSVNRFQFSTFWLKLAKAAPATRGMPWIRVLQTLPSIPQGAVSHQKSQRSPSECRPKVEESPTQNGSARKSSTSPWPSSPAGWSPWPCSPAPGTFARGGPEAGQDAGPAQRHAPASLISGTWPPPGASAPPPGSSAPYPDASGHHPGSSAPPSLAPGDAHRVPSSEWLQCGAWRLPVTLWASRLLCPAKWWSQCHTCPACSYTMPAAALVKP